MTEREALNLALEALETLMIERGSIYDKATTAIKEALAQPEQEPDYYGLTADHLWMSISKDHYDRLNPEYRMTCYTTPPQRKPLTDEEIWDEVKAADLDWQTGWSLDEDASNRYITFARAIEAAHGIKGEA